MTGQLNPRRLRLAIGLLLMGVAVFVWSMYGYLFGGAAQLEAAEGAFITVEEGEEGAETTEVSNSQDSPERSPAAGISQDLLAQHGSFDRRTEVRSPFKWIPPPAPAVEVAEKPATKPELGAGTGKSATKPPPSLNLTMILRAKQIQRAVVDGSVVGVGDRVAAGVVTGIRANGIEIDTGTRVLFYEISRAGPRAESAHEAPTAPHPTETNKREGNE